MLPIRRLKKMNRYYSLRKKLSRLNRLKKISNDKNINTLLEDVQQKQNHFLTIISPN